jgi:hypothetical protein
MVYSASHATFLTLLPAMNEIERKGQKLREGDLAAENERLRRRAVELEAVVERLRVENEWLRAALEEAPSGPVLQRDAESPPQAS